MSTRRRTSSSTRGWRPSISIIRFESAEALRRWREQPEHREAQRRGKEEFFAAYDVEVCEVTRAYDFGRS
jgi:heme-degrading monooxygenase HmoA